MTDTEPRVDAAVEHHVAELGRDGYSLRHDAVAPELCDEILAAMARMDGTWGRSLVQAFHGRRTVRYFDLLNADPVFQQPPIHGHILPVVRGVLGHDCLLSTYGTASIGPGEPAQAIHADDILYRLPRPHRDIFCNVMIALSDFTEENGATRIVPGSHAWDEYPEIRMMPDGQIDDRYPSIAAEMPKGSLCFFLGTTYHGGGANHSDAFRHGITMAYCAGWLRPQENFALAVAQERAATFDPDLRALMGWRPAHNGSLGIVYTHPRHFSGPLVHTLVTPQAPQADLPVNVSGLLLEIYGRIPPLARDAADGLDAEQLVETPAPGTNSIGWLVWHLARVQDHLIAELLDAPQLWATGDWAGRFALDPDPRNTGYGHTPEQVAAVRPDRAAALLDYLDAVDARTRSFLEGVGEDDLDRIVDRRWDPPVTLGVRLVSVADDCLQHAGQAAYVRGLLGA